MQGLGSLLRGRPIVVALLALLGLWTVHITGFVARVPSGFIILLDAYFFANFLFVFSYSIAMAVVIGRFTPIIIGGVSHVMTIQRLIFRYRRRGIRNSWAVTYGYERMARRSRSLAMPIGNRTSFSGLFYVVSYMTGAIQYRAESKYQRVLLAVQIIAGVFFFFLIYLSFTYAVVLTFLLSLGFLTVVILSNDYSDALFGKERDRTNWYEDTLTALLDPRKWVTMAIIFALASGSLRFSVLEAGHPVEVELGSSRDVIVATLLLKTVSGTVVHQNSNGRIFFIPDAAILRVSSIAP